MILRADAITKRFGGICALDKVSFEIEEGSIVGLIGPNGAGKTTLFNCINGTLPIDDGRIYFCGEEITNKRSYELARLGMCRSYQIVKPFRSMTVLQNAMVGAFCRVKSRKSAQEIATEALETVGLYEKRDEKASNLNIGESKKLEIAKAFSTKPKLLLLDEVMAGILPSEVKVMSKIVRDINESGVTIILIEHIMEAIMSLSERIIVLNFGEKIAEGAASEVVRNSEVIKAYLGVEEE
ncbi:MAG: ABC transporter ATP-binding protein [Eubacteriales bacterium]|nr:ABC transporter ATP-binding protein [Eubacteriales bacterium]MDD4390629.1 ABC transporter ATP-binding protein [Eubacteriales bacterium]